MTLDKVFRERESLNVASVEAINKASEAWGITCLRYEIRDIKLPSRVHEAMQMQVQNIANSIPYNVNIFIIFIFSYIQLNFRWKLNVKNVQQFSNLKEYEKLR